MLSAQLPSPLRLEAATVHQRSCLAPCLGSALRTSDYSVLQVLRPDSIGGYFQVHGMESASGMTSRTLALSGTAPNEYFRIHQNRHRGRVRCRAFVRLPCWVLSFFCVLPSLFGLDNFA